MTKAGFDAQLHKNVLTKILVGIYKTQKSKLGFKGGTAAMLFYDLPRLSMDLDFDLLSDLNREDKDNILEVLSKHGEILEEQDKKYTLFYLLSYESGKPNIKIELNKRIWDNNNYIDKWLLGVDIKLADKPTLFTNKLVALTDRKQPVARDLYDVHFFSKMEFPLNQQLIREGTGKSKAELISYTLDYIDEYFNSANVLQGLAELIDEDQKPWIKDHLIEDTKLGLKNL